MRRPLAVTGTALLAVALLFAGATSASAADVTETHEGMLLLGETAQFPVYLEAGDAIHIVATCPGGDIDPFAFLSLDGALVAYNDDGGPDVCNQWRSSVFDYTVTVTGTYFAGVSAVSGNGAYRLTFTSPEHSFAFTSANAVAGQVGAALSLPVTTTLVDATFAVTGGTLPDGVTFDGVQFLGTPTTSGVYTVDITASLQGRTVVQSVTITVVPAVVTPALADTGVDISMISLSAVTLLAAGGILLYTRRRYAQ